MSGEGPKNRRQRAREERDALVEMTKAKSGGLDTVKAQLRQAAKVAAIVLVSVWLLAVAFATGLDTLVPYGVAAVITIAAAVATVLILRNLQRSEAIGSLLTDADKLSPEVREAELAKLEAQVAKGDATAILAKAQLLMQESPREALTTLEKVDLEKAQKLVAGQVRAMRAMIHLNLGEVKSARDLVDAVDLAKAPDPKARGNLAAVVAEAWARSGNPIEASELLDKYDPEDKDFADLKVQLLRARIFACAHRQDMNGMRRALKALNAVSPQLPAMFVGQKRIHPLLEKEARKVLEKSGLIPKPRFQVARR